MPHSFISEHVAPPHACSDYDSFQKQIKCMQFYKVYPVYPVWAAHKNFAVLVQFYFVKKIGKIMMLSTSVYI